MSCHRHVTPVLAALAVLAASSGRAATIESCAGIDDDHDRLGCYDRLSGRRAAPAAGTDAKVAKVAETAAEGPMTRAWGTPGDAGTRYLIRPYKPVYLFPVFASNRINDTANSPTQPAGEALGLKGTEAKFQISFKSRLASNLFGDNGDIWGAYTQSSRWQVYNASISRPFRESDYEPEAMFVWKTRQQVLGLRVPYLAAGINHQSNGRSNPLSRSWNRVIGQVGFEKDDFTATFRFWHRIPERRTTDDNPDLVRYAGRGDILLTQSIGRHKLSALLRPPLSAGQGAYGALRLDWAFPIAGNLRGHLQWFTGWGESLIDYNHRAQYLGLGVSLIEWY
jgi:phospholipase A1